MNRFALHKDSFERAGFISLCATVFLISFPRSWSLYPLALMLIMGLLLWVFNFKNLISKIIPFWYLVIPPVLYFTVHIISILIQGAEISLLTARLMFLLIPVFGFPIFFSDLFRLKLSVFLHAFISGILLISIYLLTRNMINIFQDYPGSLSMADWLHQNELTYFSIGFSGFEHPTYLSMKADWALVLVLITDNFIKERKSLFFSVIVLLSAMLFFLASKAGLFIWMIIILFYFINSIIMNPRRIAINISLIALFVCAVLIILKIDRINDFLSSTKDRFEKKETDLMKMDQRTREWHAVVQVISEYPFFGTGLKKAEERLVNKYIENGFIDESELKMNAHNQFLEAQMTFGIFGSATLLLMILAPVIFLRKVKLSGLIISFLLLIMSFMMIESMFNRQWGIMFFLIFYYVLISQLRLRSDNSEKN